MSSYTPHGVLPSLDTHSSALVALPQVRFILKEYHEYVKVWLSEQDLDYEKWLIDNLEGIIANSDKLVMVGFACDELHAKILSNEETDPYTSYIERYPDYRGFVQVGHNHNFVDMYESFRKYKTSILHDCDLSPRDKFLLFVCHSSIKAEDILLAL